MAGVANHFSLKGGNKRTVIVVYSFVVLTFTFYFYSFLHLVFVDILHSTIILCSDNLLMHLRISHSILHVVLAVRIYLIITIELNLVERDQPQTSIDCLKVVRIMGSCQSGRSHPEGRRDFTRRSFASIMESFSAPCFEGIFRQPDGWLVMIMPRCNHTGDLLGLLAAICRYLVWFGRQYGAI
jgi:hypothetical protein